MIDQIWDEMDDLEFEFLMPINPSAIEGYYFEMRSVARNGNWMAYIVLPDDREFKMVYFDDTGKIRFDKNEAYYEAVKDANEAYPLDSCAIDTLSAFLMMVDARGWDDGEDL